MPNGNGNGRKKSQNTYTGFKASETLQSPQSGINRQAISQAPALIMSGDITVQTAIGKYWEVYHNIPNNFKANPQLEEDIQEILKNIAALGEKSDRPMRTKIDYRKHAYIMAVTKYCPWFRR